MVCESREGVIHPRELGCLHKASHLFQRFECGHRENLSTRLKIEVERKWGSKMKMSIAGDLEARLIANEFGRHQFHRRT